MAAANRIRSMFKACVLCCIDDVVKCGVMCMNLKPIRKLVCSVWLLVCVTCHVVSLACGRVNGVELFDFVVASFN